MNQFMLMRFAHLWGDKQVSWGRPCPLNSQPHLIPFVGIFIGKVRDADTASSDGEGALPTSPPIHHSFFVDIICFVFFKERSHSHIHMLKDIFNLNKLFVKD